VRTALGASRGRIVSQLFAEALVLGGLAAVIGMAVAVLFLRNWAMTFLEINYGRLPFWWDLSLSPATITAAIVLTVLAATVAGVMPALKITRGMGDRLKQTTAGAGGLRFGGVWTVVIVAQVAITVVFPAVAWFENVQLGRMQDFNPGFATEQFLAVSIESDAPVNNDEVILDTTIDGNNATIDAFNQKTGIVFVVQPCAPGTGPTSGRTCAAAGSVIVLVGKWRGLKRAPRLVVPTPPALLAGGITITRFELKTRKIVKRTKKERRSFVTTPRSCGGTWTSSAIESYVSAPKLTIDHRQACRTR